MEINWYPLMAIANREFNITPEVFWNMTLREFVALTKNYSSAENISRDELEELRDAFPD
jgi:uncharacterized phage protein (TIGR02216 family)